MHYNEVAVRERIKIITFHPVAEGVQVTNRTVPANLTVSVALEIVHAGATNLPLAILCRTV